MTTDELIAKYLPQAKTVARIYCKKCHLSGSLVDEIEADALVALWESAKVWDQERGIHFQKFLNQRILWKISDSYRKTCHTRALRFKAHPLDAIEPWIVYDNFTVLYVEESMARLRPRDQFIVRLTANGYQETEIAKMLGVTKSAISQAKTRIHSLERR